MGTYVAGLCTFLGENPKFPTWGIMIVIDRLPITNIDLSKIILYDGNKDPRYSI